VKSSATTAAGMRYEGSRYHARASAYQVGRTPYNWGFRVFPVSRRWTLGPAILFDTARWRPANDPPHCSLAVVWPRIAICSREHYRRPWDVAEQSL